MAKPPSKQVETTDQAPDKAVQCGIIMPIAAMGDYDARHWGTVLELVTRAIKAAEMEASPVWAKGPADVIQERIVRNLFDQPFAVCDISGQNPNVMLELGLRLAFGKPTIIINDEQIRAPFDIGAIEYVPYSRSLQILDAEEFIERLVDKINGVRDLVDRNEYKAFIKTFGQIEFGTLGNEAIPVGRAVLDQLEQLGAAVRRLEAPRSSNVADGMTKPENAFAMGQRLSYTARMADDQVDSVEQAIRSVEGVNSVISDKAHNGIVTFRVFFGLSGSIARLHRIRSAIESIFLNYGLAYVAGDN